MKIAVFGSSVSERFLPVLDEFFGFLQKEKIEVQLYRPFYEFLREKLKITPYHTSFFLSSEDFNANIYFIFSVEGDGTFLHSVVTIGNFDIPVVGVNGGRLGFLADIAQEQIQQALTDIFNNNYSILNRSLLEVEL